MNNQNKEEIKKKAEYICGKCRVDVIIEKDNIVCGNCGYRVIFKKKSLEYTEYLSR
jgi:DNA-directed RNA polymerase subunit RPC12/RpoP